MTSAFHLVTLLTLASYEFQSIHSLRGKFMRKFYNLHPFPFLRIFN